MYRFQEGDIVSEATLRPYDLVWAFAAALLAVDPERANALEDDVPEEAWGDDSHAYWSSESADWTLEALFDELRSHAPEGLYFGAHEGDGTCFGFWAIDEPTEELTAS